MKFAQAVAAAHDLGPSSAHPGKQAFAGTHAGLVTAGDPTRFTASVNLDDSLRDRPKYRHASRWDYGLGFRESPGQECAIWIEVHPASTSEVSTVLNKLAWLKDWLNNEVPELARLCRRTGSATSFHWLATPAGVHIRPGSPQARRLHASGLDMPRRQLVLR